MKKRNARTVVLLGVLVSASLALAEPRVPESLRLAFSPYGDGPLHSEGTTPGVTIDQHAWQAAEQLLPSEILQLVQNGDFTLTVQETTDLPARASYIAATAGHFPGVALDSGYKIEHYQGGRP